MPTPARTPEGWPNRCPICGKHVRIEPSPGSRDAPCPNCGHLLWFTVRRPAVPRCSARPSGRRALAILLLSLGVVLALAALAWDQAGPPGMFGLSIPERIILLVIVVLLFGRRLPEVGRYLARILARWRR